jgi:hypothetical protein
MMDEMFGELFLQCFSAKAFGLSTKTKESSSDYGSHVP